MSYHIYHTEAVLLGGTFLRESDRLLFFYTKDFGLLTAHARSIREIKSRLRYVLQQFGYSEIDLIRGKHGWKLITAKAVASQDGVIKHKGRRVVLARYVQLLRRLIQGEEKNSAVYDDIKLISLFLEQAVSREEFEAIEILFVARLLYHLGYWDASEGGSFFIAQELTHKEILSTVTMQRIVLLNQINKSLRNTDL